MTIIIMRIIWNSKLGMTERLFAGIGQKTEFCPYYQIIHAQTRLHFRK